MKITLTAVRNADEYVNALDGWQKAYTDALRGAILSAVSELDERLKWGHLVYFLNGPVLLVRAEVHRVLFGFWRGQRQRPLEPRLQPGGKYEMATLELKEDTPLLRTSVLNLVVRAVALNRSLGDPTDVRRSP